MYARAATVRRGFGDIVSGAASGAASGLATAGISAGVQLATTAAALWMNSIQLSHQADTATTQIVNGLEPLLRQNVAAYLAGPRTCADQAAAISAYLSAYQWLISPAACGNGAYGSAGNRCISDRFGPGGATDTTGTQWPWAAYYYQPIADDQQAAGCAAALMASNPDAGEQSAIQNILSLTQGSTAQTTPGLYAGTPMGTVAQSTAGGSVISSAGTNLFSTDILGIPIWVWGVGVLALAITL